MMGSVMRSLEDLGVEPSEITGIVGAPLLREIEKLIQAKLETRGGRPYKRGVGTFNDHPRRTKEEVLGILQSIIRDD